MCQVIICSKDNDGPQFLFRYLQYVEKIDSTVGTRMEGISFPRREIIVEERVDA